MTRAQFLSAGWEEHNFPPPIYPEFAFVGRSNVGKSSLINLLVGMKNLARTSNSPGKTRLIQHYCVEEKWYFADLPGYGFARVSKGERGRWDRYITRYLVTRKNLLNLFVLLDARLCLQAVDAGFMNWLMARRIPYVVALTKIDKLSRTKRDHRLACLRKELTGPDGLFPAFFPVSSVTGEGKAELLSFMESAGRSRPSVRP
ncbi:MAG TPA: ribosome biogenesis GTP-binding protein YihA/YsxC [Atribacteraceae bacterium]|nr:ribosome biogenesis GTP-binding protein YihA/YsxC [Atribacteraceae bacterium]